MRILCLIYPAAFEATNKPCASDAVLNMAIVPAEERDRLLAGFVDEASDGGKRERIREIARS